MANPFFSGRIPQELFDAVEKYRRSTGESKTDVLVKALSTYIDIPIKSHKPQEDKTGNEETKKLRSLEARIEALEKLITEPKQDHASQAIDASTPGQMSLDDIKILAEEEKTLESEQNSSIASDNIFDNNLDNKLLESLDPNVATDNELDNSTDNRENQQAGRTFIGAMKTEEVPTLPGLEGMDPKKIKIKLNNTRNTKAQATQIKAYFISLSNNVEEPAKGKRKGLLWDVYKLQEA